MEGVLRFIAKLLSAAYTTFAYFLFAISLLYLVGFVANRYTPSSIDSGLSVPFAEALRTNLLLLVLFAAQHSGMARSGFKRYWTKIVPEHLERSTYLLATAIVLGVMFRYWEAMPESVWRIEQPIAAWTIRAAGWAGIALIVLANAVWSHAEFTGIRHTLCFVRGKPYEPDRFRERGVYRWVRHPMMLGVILWLWATPSISRGRFLFAAFFTLYILVAIRWEERNLLRQHGTAYEEYRRRVPALLPFRR